MNPSLRHALRALTVSCALGLAASASADPRPGPTAVAKGLAGRWLTASGALEVDLSPCGPAWCGTVSRVLSNRRMSPAAVADAPAAGLLGLKILHGLTPSGPDEWQGKVTRQS